MSYRNMKWLNNRRIIYRRNPINDKPTMETSEYMFYEKGTYEHYHLFNSKAKITTYRSLKWHMLVLYYLNDDDNLSPMGHTHMMNNVFRFIADKENGFVTFFIKHKLLDNMIQDVIKIGGEAPINKKRKIIFKDYCKLSFDEKMKIVGKLAGRKKISENKIYDTMLDINNCGAIITIQYLADLLECSTRTIYRNISKELKQEKQKLNEEV